MTTLTPTQSWALHQAAKMADHILDGPLSRLTGETRLVLRSALIAVQLQAVRKVAKMPSKARLEIAGLTDEVCIEFASADWP